MNADSQNIKFDLVVFSAVPYDHLLRGRTGAFVDIFLKRGVFVYYFEIPPASVLQIIKEPTFRKRGIKNFFFPLVTIKENLAVFAFPPILPASRYDTGWIKEFNIKRFVTIIQKKFYPLAKNRDKKTVALVVTPYWYDIVKHLDFSMVCYDCIDDIKVFCKDKQIAYFAELQQKLVEKSDLIIISAQRLKDEILAIRNNAPIEYIANGVEFDMFAKQDNNLETPDSIKQIPKPIVGFIGSLFKWVDIDLIEKSAKTYPNYSFVLVGPVHEIKIPSLHNIYHLGPKPYQSIPSYINAFDVCLIPFIADPLSDKVDPIKAYEYLTLGKPVIAINLPELEKMKDLIYLAKNDDDFIKSIAIAINEDNQVLKQRRIEYAKENSWYKRVDDLISIINKYLNKKFNENRS